MKITQQLRIDETTSSKSQCQIKGWTVGDDGKDQGYCIIGWPKDEPLPLIDTKAAITFEVL